MDIAVSGWETRSLIFCVLRVWLRFGELLGMDVVGLAGFLGGMGDC